MTTGPDTLPGPLTPTRECLYTEDARAEIVRNVFCGGEWHVRFVRGLLIFSDYLDGRADAVMGAGETTAILFNAAMPDRPVHRLLDLGCGAGTLALLMSSCAQEVVATDINARAVEVTRFNAEVNRISLDVRQGDLFGPVRGEQFDRMVSQPPYYPGTVQTFLHGGPAGCELTDRIIAEVPRYLTSGGLAIIHTSLPFDHPTPEGTIEYTPGIGEVAGTPHSLIVIRREPVPTCRIGVRPDRRGQIPDAGVEFCTSPKRK